MDKTIISIFTDTDDAEQAISKLEERDYNPKDISIIMKERDNKGNIAKKNWS